MQSESWLSGAGDIDTGERSAVLDGAHIVI